MGEGLEDIMDLLDWTLVKNRNDIYLCRVVEVEGLQQI